MDGDIYRYSVENNEGAIDNLMGGEVTTNFNAVEKYLMNPLVEM